MDLLPTWYDVDDVDTLGRLVAELADVQEDIARHTRVFLGRHQELLASLARRVWDSDRCHRSR